MEVLTIALLVVLLGNQIYLERTVAKLRSDMKYILKWMHTLGEK